MKPESYPFLRVAKQYGLDYSAVLITADNLKRNGRAEYLHGVQPADALNAMIDIAHAVDTYKQICDGVIDWQTGEYTKSMVAAIDGHIDLTSH